MSEALKSYLRAMYGEQYRPTSSAESQSGHTLSDSQVGQMTPKSGRGAARASRGATQAKVVAQTTLATSGRPGSGSSKSIALQSFFSSRLPQRLASTGSTLYELTWKQRATPLGLPICQLQASAHRTNASDFSAVPTPMVNDSKGSDYSYDHGDPNNICLKLGGAAKLSSVPTPTASLGSKGVRSDKGAIIEAMRKNGVDLGAIVSLSIVPTPGTYARGGQDPEKRSGHQVMLNDVVTLSTVATPAANEAGGTPEQFLARKVKAAAGSQLGISLTSLSLQAQLSTVTTPSARDWKDTSGMPETGVDPDGSIRSRLDQLPRQAQLAVSGETATGTSVETEKRGQLAGAYSLWLMGLPPEWEQAAPWKNSRGRGSSKQRATPSRRGSRRSSSKPSSTSHSTSEHSAQSNERLATDENKDDTMANPGRKALLKSLSKASMSGVGNNFKDGKYRLAIKRMALEDGFKGTRFQVTFTVMNALKIAVQSKKTNEVLNIEPNPVFSDVDWMQTKLTEKDSAGPGNIRRFMCDLFDKKEISDEEYEETLAEMCDIDFETGDPLAEPLSLARGMVIDMETIRIVTAKNKVEIIATKWSNVKQTEEERLKVCEWLDQVTLQQEASEEVATA
jgi:hypothetical protein